MTEARTSAGRVESAPDSASNRVPDSALSSALSDAQIHDRIVAAVLDHRLAPGTKLVEERLGRVFGVSRTRIRQVLIRLSEQRIVTLTPNRGATIAQPDPVESREVFAARRLIEPSIVEAFAAVSGRAELARLDRIIHDEHRAIAADRRGDAIRLSGEFHLAIAEGAGNQTLARMLGELVFRTSLVLMTYGSSQPHGAGPAGGCDGDAHHSLLAALRERRGAAAGRLMQAHLQDLEDHLNFELPDNAGIDLETLFASPHP
jgi:DNA-binding GntR family transcriptional regulator